MTRWIVVATAAFALGASAPAAAADHEAQFGRCVKVAKGEAGAEYADSHCAAPAAEGAHYRWLAGPGSHAGFTASAGSVALTLYAANGRAAPTVQCSAASTIGQFTGPTSETLSLTLTGCEMGSAQCASSGAASGEVAFSPLQGTLVISKPESFGEALVLWTPQLGETLASFECGTTAVTIEGGILHALKANKMLSSEAERLRTYKDGLQRPSCYEPCTTGEAPETTVGGVTAPFSGLSFTGTQKDEEAIEASTRR